MHLSDGHNVVPTAPVKRGRTERRRRKKWTGASASAMTAALLSCSSFPALADDHPSPDAGDGGAGLSLSIPTTVAPSWKGPEREKPWQYLFLRPRVKDLPPGDFFVEAIDMPGHLFLTLDDVARVLDFAITVDHDGAAASGFFIAPENVFRLDAEKGLAQVGDKDFSLTHETFRRHNGQFYVSTKALASWFGINTQVDREEGAIRFFTDTLLPREERQKRHKKWSLLAEAYDINGVSPLLAEKIHNPGANLAKPLPFLGRAAGAPQDGQAVNVHTLSGEAPAGHDIELYRDGALIAAKTVSGDGRYAFPNIPLKSGVNTFTIAFYGPQGQRWEKTEAVTSAYFDATIAHDGTAAAQEAASPAPETARTEAAKPHAPLPKEAAAQKADTKEVTEQPAAALRNWSELAIVRGHASLGSVESIVQAQGTFVRLDRLLGSLGIAYRRPDKTDALEIVFADGRKTLLDISKNAYVEDGRESSLYANDAIHDDGKIYANVTLLNRMLAPLQFIENLAARSIDVADASGGLAALWSEKKLEPDDVAPAPMAAPAIPVIIDDSSGRQGTSGTPLPEQTRETTDVLRIEDKPDAAGIRLDAALEDAKPPETKDDKGQQRAEAPPEAKERADAEQPDAPTQSEEILILQPRIKRLPATQDFIEALDAGGRVFLPLNDLAQMLEFPIKVNAALGTAEGFFLSPENDFRLDVAAQTVKIGKDVLKLDAKDVIARDGQIFVSDDAFNVWFGIRAEVDRKFATVHLTTDRLLPQEEREERQKRWHKLINTVESRHEAYPVLDNPYEALGRPAIDVNLGSQYARNRESGGAARARQNPVGDYNVQGSADIAYMTGQFYAQGSSSGRLIDTLRGQLGRKDPSSNLLGPLRATEFAMGDVTSPSISLVTSNALGRGAFVSNRDLSSPENFDVRTFTGDSVPGYEAELYRNNVLIAFQTVGPEGRYTFNDIPILYGENIFRIVFYGPQGQREERVETVSALSALLKENQFVYTFGAEERGVSLAPIGKTSTANVFMPPGLQATGSVRYGLTRDITIGAAMAQTKLSDGDHRYASATAAANIEGVLTEASAARDIGTGGWAASFSGLGGFEGVSLRAKYRRFSGFVSESVNNLDTPLTSDASVDVNTQLLLPVIGGYSVGFSALREAFVNPVRAPRHTFGWRSSKSFWGLSLTNTVNYIADENTRWQNMFGVQTRLWDIDWRTVGTYEMKPTRQFRNLSFSADYRLADRLSGKSIFEKDLSETGRTTFGQSLNWDFDSFRLSFNGQMDNSKNISVGLNLIFSINHDPAAKTWRMHPQQASSGGAIAGRVFVDENNNNVYDEGEKIVPEAKVRVNRLLTKADKDGYFIAPVTPHEPARVELDTSSIADPLLTPLAKGYQVNTRPGNTVVADFPLTYTTVIDGTVFFNDGKDVKREMGDVVVELQDKDGKPLRRVLSGLDGYFSIDKVAIGEYWLSVADEALAAVNANVESKVHIKIDEIDAFLTGKDIVLRQKEVLNGPPVFDDMTDTRAPAEAQPDTAKTGANDPEAATENESGRDDSLKKTLNHYAPPSWPGLEAYAAERPAEDTISALTGHKENGGAISALPSREETQAEQEAATEILP